MAAMTKKLSPFWKYAFLFLLLLMSMIIMRDIFPRVAQKIERSKMTGGLSNAEYFHAVHTSALKFLNEPKRVRLNDQRRLMIIEDIREWRGNALTFSWPDAMIAKGLVLSNIAVYDSRNDAALEAYYARYLLPDGRLKDGIKYLDQTMHGEVLLYLAEKSESDRYRSAAEHMARYLLDRSGREGGTLAYRPGSPIGTLRLVDTLGMICPFLSAYGSRYRNTDATSLAVRHMKDFIRYAVEPRTGLPFHGYNPEENNEPIGAIGWGRGAGWYALGLIDTIRYLPRDDPERKQLEKSASRLAETIHRYQRKEGGWRAVINVASPFDSSATAMLSYFLKRALEEGIIDESYQSTIDRALDALKRHTRSNGKVDYAQGDRMDVDKASSRFEPAPYAQGMTLAFVATVITGDNGKKGRAFGKLK